MKKLRLQPVWATALLVVCSACTSLDQADQPVKDNADTIAVRPLARYAQMSFGKEASFALCVEPVCPKVTPKTLMTEPVADRALPAAEPAASLPSLPSRSARAARARAAGPDASKPIATTSSVPQRVVVHFPSGSAELTAGAKQALVQALSKTQPPKKILIAGYGDSEAKPDARDPLMLRRAMAVQAFIADTAPRLARSISIDASGSCCLGANSGSSNANEVEIVFTSFGEPK